VYVKIWFELGVTLIPQVGIKGITKATPNHMNIKHITSAAIAAASIITTPLPSFAEKDPPYIEIINTVAVHICYYHNGYVATTKEAAQRAWDALIADGYTPSQISNITQRFKSEIIKLSSLERCAEYERRYQEKKSRKAGSWS